MKMLSDEISVKNHVKESTLTIIIVALLVMIAYLIREGLFLYLLPLTHLMNEEMHQQGRHIYIQVEGRGVYPFPPHNEVTLRQVLDRAGIKHSSPSTIKGDTRIKTGSKIMIAPDGTLSVAPMDGEKLLLFHLPLDINRAGVKDLEALTGIGERLAQRIVESRDEHGDFQSLDDLTRVAGLGKGKLGQIKEFIAVR
jgi:competence ComEA-like helix-hairpin-helix protein